MSHFKTAYQFYYHWPRLQKQLEHKTHNVTYLWRLSEEVPTATGHWLFAHGTWFRGYPPKWDQVDSDTVPKDIRATALLLNL